MPPSRSGIADYSALLLPALRERVDVTVARPGRLHREPEADVALYHVGNDPEEHGWIVEALRRRPGVVVLHDFVLHHLAVGLTFGRGDAAGYLAVMEREYGLLGRLLAYAVLDNRIPPLWETRPEDFPLAGEVLSLATGLIVHSRYVEARARAAGFDGPISRIAHPAWPVPDVEPRAIEGAPLFGCFGNLNESKRIQELLAGFARLRERVPAARLLLVGSASRRLDALGLPAGVVREGRVDEDRLWSLMAACDAIVSLRSPTMGETSGTAIRALSLGKPLVVSDVGWFSELPDDVAVKVPVGELEVETLAAGLEALADPAVRARMSEAARRLVATEHSLDAVADAYAAALAEMSIQAAAA
jgi:glycosyltransferase involved in cell wall biosynthesis